MQEFILTLYGPYILESIVHDGFAFIKKGGFPNVKYGNNWHVKGYMSLWYQLVATTTLAKKN